MQQQQNNQNTASVPEKQNNTNSGFISKLGENLNKKGHLYYLNENNYIDPNTIYDLLDFGFPEGNGMKKFRIKMDNGTSDFKFRPALKIKLPFSVSDSKDLYNGIVLDLSYPNSINPIFDVIKNKFFESYPKKQNYHNGYPFIGGISPKINVYEKYGTILKYIKKDSGGRFKIILMEDSNRNNFLKKMYNYSLKGDGEAVIAVKSIIENKNNTLSFEISVEQILFKNYQFDEKNNNENEDEDEDEDEIVDESLLNDL